MYILQNFNDLRFSNIIVRQQDERRETRDESFFSDFKIQNSTEKGKWDWKVVSDWWLGKGEASPWLQPRLSRVLQYPLT